MSNISLKLEFDDIVFNGDNQLQLIQDNDSLGQQYKVLIETQYESDFRDSSYGFKLQELIQSDFGDIETLIDLFVREVIMQHPKTDIIESLSITNLGNRSYGVNAVVKIKPEENQTITIGSELIV